MKHEQEIVFFAYQGRYDGLADENVDSIKHAIVNYNKYQKTYLAKSWEDYRKTTSISHEILNAIDVCNIFVCDITYFNHNVLFELGYAIAKNKYILILLNERIVGAKGKYNEFILKTIRYTRFTNSKDITIALNDRNYEKDLLGKFINLGTIDEITNDIFYIQSKIQNQASLELVQTINDFKDKKFCTLVCDDVAEIEYRPLPWYFQNIVNSRIVLIHFLGMNIEQQSIENAKNSFYAGISCGFNRQILLTAPSKYKAPLDYSEILLQYEDSTDLCINVEEWLDRVITLFGICGKKVELIKKEHEFNLIKLGVGCEIAEEEKEGLLSYFVETASYNAALNYEKSLVVGRKGSGKSAIYIKLLDEVSQDPLNFIINLKPESDELLEDIEMSTLFGSKASKRSFFFTVWKMVIYSKLAEFICERIISKPTDYQHTNSEDELINFVTQNKVLIKMNFFGVIREISKRVKNISKVENADILQDLYREYLGPLIKIVKDYCRLNNLKYYKIIILADNLDKAWDSKNYLDAQTEMLLTLLEMENKIKKDLEVDKETRVEVKEMIFIRKDIFEYVLKDSNEPDKLALISHEINWEEYPSLLKTLIDNRFKHILTLRTEEDVEQKGWKAFFDLGHKDKRHPYEIIKEIIILRPRDLIYFVRSLFESAINQGHAKVNKEDLQYAINSYTIFLNKNLIAETKAEFPEVENILAKLQEHRGEKLEYGKFCKIVKDFGYDSKKLEKLVKTLFEKDYMVGFDDKTNQSFTDLEILHKKLKERKYFVFKNKVYVIAHAKYYYIKKKIFASF